MTLNRIKQNKKLIIFLIIIMLLFLFGFVFKPVNIGYPIAYLFGTNTYLKDSTGYITTNKGFKTLDSLSVLKDAYVFGKILFDSTHKGSITYDGYNLSISNNKSGSIQLNTTSQVTSNASLRTEQYIENHTTSSKSGVLNEELQSCISYLKDNRYFIIAYNYSGINKYRYLDLYSSDAVWIFSETEP